MNWRKIAIRIKSVMAGDGNFESNEAGLEILRDDKSTLYGDSDVDDITTLAT